MRKGIFKYYSITVLFILLLILASCTPEERFEVVNIPCEPKVSLPATLDTIALTSDLSMFASASVINYGDSMNENQLRLIRSDDYEIAFGYCDGQDLFNIEEACDDFMIFLEGKAEIELPLVFNTNPMLAHPLFNTPFAMKICQDDDTLGALIWKDPEGSIDGSIEFDVFLNLERSTTIFRVGSGWAKDESAFQQVRNIVNTISKAI